jgi:exodeoxyribonuclease VII large subunit
VNARVTIETMPIQDKSKQAKVYTVSELTRRVRAVLETHVGHVWVEGELSNVRKPSSGHVYLTLKDDRSQLTGVLFRGDQQGLKIEPVDGIKVRVFGDITVYEARGNYQMIIRHMEGGGKGTLQEQFEKLKEKLKTEGLFSAERKRPLPMLPQHVGVVTSATGAAIRDILNVVSRRFPNLHVVIWPVKVQGDGAGAEIAAAIDGLNARGGIDALIVGRGGGSIEDLWAFNEEVVARAIARSGIPVISAVGHEIDFTISDFVADVRAPTPSAAAELVVGTKEAFEEQLAGTRMRLTAALRDHLSGLRTRLSTVSGHYVFREPSNLVDRYRRQVQSLQVMMRHTLQQSVGETSQRLDDLGMRMSHRVAMQAQAARHRLTQIEAQLRALSPMAVLGRGYSITRDESGHVLRGVEAIKAGQAVTTTLAQGSFTAEVQTVDKGIEEE